MLNFNDYLIFKDTCKMLIDTILCGYASALLICLVVWILNTRAKHIEIKKQHILNWGVLLVIVLALWMIDRDVYKDKVEYQGIAYTKTIGDVEIQGKIYYDPSISTSFIVEVENKN